MARWKTKWRHGDKKLLAWEAGVCYQFLVSIINGTRVCPLKHAKALETASYKLGYSIPAEEWLFPDRRRAGGLLVFSQITVARATRKVK